jgi:hypothetical protein
MLNCAKQPVKLALGLASTAMILSITPNPAYGQRYTAVKRRCNVDRLPRSIFA